MGKARLQGHRKNVSSFVLGKSIHVFDHLKRCAGYGRTIEVADNNVRYEYAPVVVLEGVRVHHEYKRIQKDNIGFLKVFCKFASEHRVLVFIRAETAEDATSINDSVEEASPLKGAYNETKGKTWNDFAWTKRELSDLLLDENGEFADQLKSSKFVENGVVTFVRENMDPIQAFREATKQVQPFAFARSISTSQPIPPGSSSVAYFL